MSGEQSLAVGVDSLSKIKFCETLEQIRHDLSGEYLASEQVLGGFRQMREGLSQLSQSVQSISSATAKATDHTRAEIDTLGSVDGQMQRLKEDFAKMRQFLGEIGRVALQSKILALNASIEAAHAGVAGDGFAVVASEVGSMAQQVSALNEEIGGIVSNLNTEVDRTVGVIASANSRMLATLGETEGNSRNLHAAASRLEEISRTMCSSTSSLDQIQESLRTTSGRTDDLCVLGRAYENLVVQLRRFSGERPDPLERLVPLARRSSFRAPSRFTTPEPETLLAEEDTIISITDTKGRITFANDTFCRIAEYTPGELIGRPHNLVRHPDMPKTAFADLWAHIQQGRMWQGYVKNRSRSGAIYWVKAAVFSQRDASGQITGYISVRMKPTRDAISRAIEIYRRLP